MQTDNNLFGVTDVKSSGSSTMMDYATYVTSSMASLVDKTGMLPYLVSKRRVVYLRPRRFGKSLTLSTLKYFFCGATQLFREMAIYNESFYLNSFHWCPADEVAHNFPPCPVLHFDFSARRCETANEFRTLLMTQLKTNGEACCIPPDVFIPSGTDQSISISLGLLIDALCRSKWNKWGKVVVLVDEYDSLLNRWSFDVSIDEKIKTSNILKDMFSLIKSKDSLILFAYVTGITSFGIAGLYSGANNFVNLSNDPKLHSLCGFTEAEVKSTLGEISDEDFQTLKDYYNGYSFVLDSTVSSDTVPRVFNPYAINRYHSERKLQPYWSLTNSESLVFYLPDICRLAPRLPYSIRLSSLLSNTDYVSLSTNQLDTLAKILFESGYLTISGFSDAYTVILDFPNQEVQETVLLDFRRNVLAPEMAFDRLENVKNSLLIYDDLLPLFEFANEIRINSAFYRNSLYDTEASWHELVALMLHCIGGMNYSSEQSNAMGRSDLLLLTTSGTLFVIEFKLLKFEKPKPTRKVSKRVNSTAAADTSDASSLRPFRPKLIKSAQELAESGIEQILNKKYEMSTFYSSNKDDIKSVQYVAVVAVNSKDVPLRQFFYILQRSKDGKNDMQFFPN